MEFRPATTNDYESIVRLLPTQEELFLVYPKGKHPFTLQQVHEIAAARKALTVAVHEGEVIGFANLYNIEPGQWAYIGNVIISHPHRGTGAGRALVTHMINAVFEKQALPEARISVFNNNAAALLLYAGLGFAPYSVEERCDPEGRRVALIHMTLSRNKWKAG